MIDAGNFGDVIDVVDQGLEWRARNLGRPLALDAVDFDVIDRLALSF